jgi:transcriptional regulator GlxA family with amidase domain
VSTACGRFRTTYQGSIGLFDHLREPLTEDLADDDPIHRSLEELLTEIMTKRPGYRAVAETLVRHCLILLLRRCFEHRDCPPAWLAALDDPRLGRAVAAMQERPQEAFTLTGLAEVAGMSRSVFAARFAGALGRPPMEFLKMVRLTRAAQCLTHTDLPIKTVAARAGYSSRSSFTRAFLTRYGIDPTAFRSNPTRAATGARREDDPEHAADAA